MRLGRWVGFAACLLALGACAVSGGPGKLDVGLGWKVTQVKHPRSVAPAFACSDGYALAVESAAVVEARTVLGPERWKVVVEGAISNERPNRLLWDDLSGKMTFVCASGKTRRAYVVPRGGRGPGWRFQEHTKEPTHLPPSERGLVEIWAPLDGKAAPDDEPVALLVAGVRMEIRR